MWVVACSFRWCGHHIQIGGGVGVYYAACQAKAEDLMQPLSNFAGCVQRAPGLHLTHQLDQVRAGDGFQRTRADSWYQIVFQVQLGFVAGAFRPKR
ncbi:hypothetical protein D3C78_1804310 [compost metagenome]